MRIASVHERRLPAGLATVGALLDSLSSADDRLWPHEAWPAQRFDRPLGEGALGGHGPIRYSVERYEPGRCVRYAFAPGAVLKGAHWFEVLPTDGATVLRHVIEGQDGFWGWLRWRTVIEPLHDALIEDALDKAERQVGGAVARTARWSPRVRLMRAAFRLFRRLPFRG